MKTPKGWLLALSEILNVYMIFFHLHPSILRDFGPLCEIKINSHFYSWIFHSFCDSGSQCNYKISVKTIIEGNLF